MVLRAQDILLVLKLQAIGRPASFSHLSSSLGISASQVFAAYKRANQAGLIDEGMNIRPKAVAELIIHAVKYFMPPKLGGLTRGIPTSYAAPPLNSHILDSQEPPPVWPDATGKVRGIAFEPIYKTAPSASKEDPKLYEYLALLDAIRSGRAREVRLAEEEICRRFGTG